MCPRYVWRKARSQCRNRTTREPPVLRLGQRHQHLGEFVDNDQHRFSPGLNLLEDALDGAPQRGRLAAVGVFKFQVHQPDLRDTQCLPGLADPQLAPSDAIRLE